MCMENSNALSVIVHLGPRALIAKGSSCGVPAFSKKNKSAKRDGLSTNFLPPKEVAANSNAAQEATYARFHLIQGANGGHHIGTPIL